MQRFLDIIDKESDRLSRLISDLLDLAKIERPETLRVEERDLRDVVISGLEPLQSRREAKRIRLDLETDAPCPVRIDADRIQQVVTNLLDNAIKFAPEGGRVRIVVTRRKNSGPDRLTDGSYALVSVSDNGPGICADEQPLIFTPFHGSSKPPKRGQGTGLGLAISREIVLRHAGEIWVESKPGSGTTFHFTMPLSEQVAAAGGD